MEALLQRLHRRKEARRRQSSVPNGQCFHVLANGYRPGIDGNRHLPGENHASNDYKDRIFRNQSCSRLVKCELSYVVFSIANEVFLHVFG